MDVSLVSMPFAEANRPSIALSLLKASLAGIPISSEIVYANLRFAELIGLVSYQAVLSTPTDNLVGEWCFSGDLFPDFHPDDEAYLDLVMSVRSQGFASTLDQRKDTMRWMRSKASDYIDRLAESILERKPRIVGCSSVFQQHCASLALLKRIHELSPETLTMIGGANCEGEMGVETLRAFPWVDCVVSGEADALFPDLCRLLLDQGRQADPAKLPYGVMTQSQLRQRSNGGPAGKWPPRSIVRDLDQLPIPDYASYFDALQSSTLSNLLKPGLPAESSRGCWWGEKSHCTFCGLNGFGMGYRSKSPQRVLEELDELSGRYGLTNFQMVDNILDMSHIKTVLPHLAAAERGYTLFYETKSNLKRDQLQVLAEAGVNWIQPGIESLDDRVLKLIGKGNSALMNLQLLKWSAECKIYPSWNMLCGFPGESDEWYGEMARWLPAVFHLQPPSGVIRVRYDRFSPYHMRPGEYGITLTPSRAYAYVYPLPNESLMRLAYSFEDAGRPGHVHRGIQESPGHRALQEVVQQWKGIWQGSPPVLRTRDEDGRLQVLDTRPGAASERKTLDGLEREIYLLCNSAKSPASLLRLLSAERQEEVTWQEAEPGIEALRRSNLLLSLNGKLLSLGVREPEFHAEAQRRRGEGKRRELKRG